VETPVSDRPAQAFRHPNTGFVKGGAQQPHAFQAITLVLGIVKAANTSTVSISNNHMLDIPTGVEDAIQALDQAGTLHAGAGLSLEKAGDCYSIE